MYDNFSGVYGKVNAKDKLDFKITIQNTKADTEDYVYNCLQLERTITSDICRKIIENKDAIVNAIEETLSDKGTKELISVYIQEQISIIAEIMEDQPEQKK